MRWAIRRRPEPRERRQPDDEVAGWIREARRPFRDYAVGSLVPPVFERYARILHPASVEGDIPVRWAEIAAWSGTTIHPLVQWELISHQPEIPSPAPFDQPPRADSLPLPELKTLCGVLAGATSMPGRCFAGAWAGYGWTDMPACLLWPELRLDERAYLVTAAWIDATRGLAWPHPRELEILPSLLWPSDRAWFLAGDTDLESTYLGGSAELIETVLADPALEALPATAEDDVTVRSDSVNAGRGLNR